MAELPMARPYTLSGIEEALLMGIPEHLKEKCVSSGIQNFQLLAMWPSEAKATKQGLPGYKSLRDSDEECVLMGVTLVWAFLT